MARNEQRKEERVAAGLPVKLDGAAGVTRNVSASGLFFETGAYARGSRIRLTLEVDAPAGRMRLSCEGRIVRIEPREGGLGVAVQITDSMMRLAEGLS